MKRQESTSEWEFLETHNSSGHGWTEDLEFVSSAYVDPTDDQKGVTMEDLELFREKLIKGGKL